MPSSRPLPLGPFTTAASSATSTVLAASPAGSVYDITLTTNTTLALTGGTRAGQSTVRVYLRQGGSGGFVATLPTGVKWAGGAAPVPNTAAGRIDIFTFTTPDNGITWFGA